MWSSMRASSQRPRPHELRARSPNLKTSEQPPLLPRARPKLLPTTPTLPLSGGGSAPRLRHQQLSSQPEHEQHGLVALLLELGDELVLAARDRAQPRQDRDVLLAVDLERHRRRVEAGADVDLPELLHAGVVVGGKGAVGEAGEDEPAARGQRAA